MPKLFPNHGDERMDRNERKRTLDGVLVSPTDVIWLPRNPTRPGEGGSEIFADGIEADVCKCYSSFKAAQKVTV